MTRQEMIDVIARLASKPGAFDLPEAWETERLISEWIERAPEGWFDVMFDIINNPLDWVQYEKDHNERAKRERGYSLWLEDGWQEFKFSYLIGQGISEDIGPRLAQISPLLSRADTRPLILWSYAWTDTVPEMLPWLKPLVEQVSTVTEEEQCALAVAVGYIKTEESLQMLLGMRAAVPSAATLVQQYINDYLPRPYFQSSLSSNIRSFVQ